MRGCCGCSACGRHIQRWAPAEGLLALCQKRPLAPLRTPPAGKNATRGELKLMLNAPSYQGPSYGAPVEPATLDDARALMAALQQGLA